MPPARDEQAGQTEKFTWLEDRQGPRAYAATPTGSCMQVPHRHERLGLETTPVRHMNGQQARKDDGKNTKTKNGSRSEEVLKEHKEKEKSVTEREEEEDGRLGKIKASSGRAGCTCARSIVSGVYFDGGEGALFGHVSVHRAIQAAVTHSVQVAAICPETTRR